MPSCCVLFSFKSYLFQATPENVYSKLKYADNIITVHIILLPTYGGYIYRNTWTFSNEIGYCEFYLPVFIQYISYVYE